MAESHATSKPKTGIWLVGARGAISVATMASRSILQTYPSVSLGMITETPPFNSFRFCEWQDLCFGGCDIHDKSLVEQFHHLLKEGIVPYEFASIPVRSLERIERDVVNIRKIIGTDPTDGRGGSAVDAVNSIRKAIRHFRTVNELDRVMVVNLSSTEGSDSSVDWLQRIKGWDQLQRALHDSSKPVTWGLLYATSALLERCAFVNFTPNAGTEIPALRELAMMMRLPHAGKDGKTGETLVKSVLAPLFEERALRVLSWQSYNILGNNDGRTLSTDSACRSKVKSKDRQVRGILKRSADLHTKVTIDYVPSLGDWKTAWDYIHFEGFLGIRMAMQFIWQGCDTALAVPLVLDLIRFLELAWRNGETGHLRYLDAYFKSPAGSTDHDFRHQMDQLRAHFRRPTAE